MIGAKFEGDLPRYMKQVGETYAFATERGTRTATTRAKQLIRAQIAGAGLSRRLGNTWRDKFYKNDRVNARGFVFTRAPDIIKGLAASTVIRAAGGRYLALPTAAAPKVFAGKKVTPTNWPEGRFGKLEFVPRPGKPPLLVVKDLKASYSRADGRVRGFRPLTARQRASGRTPTATVIMFVLVPNVRTRKRIDPRAIERAARKALPDLIAAEFAVRRRRT
ncbi:DUF6441 family protein [Oceanibacterium hippocampi]|uniref:Uncharacterized protein n=1 Tax=Oceanibacterium hippocampi TaxID=745714 RepID=A0A1Y5TZD6_9PROT|nr:DUF6441 family protein [Oceanibacterium hippocampi]SLN77304.1 hypothetical protein OCH7691_04379 [Oceanibacterium hippocampi]